MSSSITENEMYQMKHLLNRLMLGLDDEHQEKDNIINDLRELSSKKKIEYDKFVNHDLSDDDNDTQDGDDEGEDASGYTDEDRIIRQLETKKKLILTNLQNQEYLSTKYEGVLDKYKELISLLNGNLKSKLKFDLNYSKIYKDLFNEKVRQFEFNLNYLDNLLIQSESNCSLVLERLITEFEEFVNEGDNEEKQA